MTLAVDAPALAAAPSRATRTVLGATLALVFAGLTTVGAYIEIPLKPVPITMQTLFVMLAGAAIGRGWGSLSQWLYVGLGVAGLPLFAGGASGWTILSGPTGGYLIAFLIAPWVIGSMLRRSESWAWQAISFTAGNVLILALGVAHLTLFYTHDVSQALAVGALPFLPGAVFKIAAALSIHRSSTALVRHYRARQQ